MYVQHNALDVWEHLVHDICAFDACVYVLNVYTFGPSAHQGHDWHWMLTRACVCMWDCFYSICCFMLSFLFRIIPTTSVFLHFSPWFLLPFLHIHSTVEATGEAKTEEIQKQDKQKLELPQKKQGWMHNVVVEAEVKVEEAVEATTYAQAETGLMGLFFWILLLLWFHPSPHSATILPLLHRLANSSPPSSPRLVFPHPPQPNWCISFPRLSRCVLSLPLSVISEIVAPFCMLANGIFRAGSSQIAPAAFFCWGGIRFYWVRRRWLLLGALYLGQLHKQRQRGPAVPVSRLIHPTSWGCMSVT